MASSILEESIKAKRKGFIGLMTNKKIIIPFAIVIILSAGGFYYYKQVQNATTNNEVSTPKNWVVNKGDIQMAIDSDGKVVAEDGVELSFSVTGDNLEISDVYVKEGQEIKKGDKIASVKTETLNLNYKNANSAYQSALASYNEKMAGATDEDKQKAQDAIKTAQQSLDSAKLSMEKTQTSANDKIATAQRALQDASKNLSLNQSELSSDDVKNAYTDLVSSLKSINILIENMLPNSDKIIGVDRKELNDAFENHLGAKDVSTLSNAVSSYDNVKTKRDIFNTAVLNLSSSSSYNEIENTAQKAQELLSAMEKHLYDMQLLLNATVTSGDLTESALASFKSTTNSDRSTINTRISSLKDNLNAIKDAKDGLDKYKNDYDDAQRNLESAKTGADQDLKTAQLAIESKETALNNAKQDYQNLLKPLTESEQASAKSSLTSASINLEKARLELDRATIKSPIDGQVSLLNYKAGDIITDNAKPVAEVINNNTLFIEANIEEADVSKIQIGSKTISAFSALDEAEIPGEVNFVSLSSETSNNGIVTYLVRILLNNSENKDIREGMTASVKFIIAGVSDALSIPVEAVRNVNGKPSVQLKNGGYQAVTTGFTDGEKVEVINGLKQGDIIIY